MLTKIKNMEKKNWEPTGLLHGLDAGVAEVVEKHLNEISTDFISEQTPEIATELDTLLPPIIRHIVFSIFAREKMEGVIKGIETQDLLDLVDVKEISELFLAYLKYFLPSGEKYLPHLDSQAHLTLLFCDNYVYGLIDKVKK